MAHILILYSTTDGHTKNICQNLKSVAERNRHDVQLFSIDDAAAVALTPFDKIVIGASIRYGKHNKKIFDFIRRNQKILEAKP